MSGLRSAMEEYLALRRSLGFKLTTIEEKLRSFVAFAEKSNADYITIELALLWVKQSTAKEPATLSGRLGIVRRFAAWRSATDPRTQVPPNDILPYRYHRKPPYIYSDEQIEDLVRAARDLPSPLGLRGPTYATLFGLIAVTGMRISEALALNRDDLDLKEKTLNIQKSKFSKSRIVPLHESTGEVLKTYAQVRDQIYPYPKSLAFFVADRGTRLTQWAVRDNFAKVSRQNGIRKPIKGRRIGRGPRIHDMRHRFAAQTLVDWYRAGINVEREIHKLSTYLGHVHVNDTYWYLEAVPELLELATLRLTHARKD